MPLDVKDLRSWQGVNAQPPYRTLYRLNDTSEFTVKALHVPDQISQHYRVIELISVNIIPSWDTEGHELV